MATSRAEVASSRRRIRGFPKEGPGDGETLGLTFREAAAPLFDLALDSVGKLFHKLPGTGEFQCFDDFLICGIGFDVAEIFCDCAGEHGISLGHIGEKFSRGGRHGKLLLFIVAGTDMEGTLLRL